MVLTSYLNRFFKKEEKGVTINVSFLWIVDNIPAKKIQIRKDHCLILQAILQ